MKNSIDINICLYSVKLKIRCQLAGTKVPQTMSLILKYAKDITDYNHEIIHTFLLTFKS